MSTANKDLVSVSCKFDPPLKLGEGPIYRAKDSTFHFLDLWALKSYKVKLDPKTADRDYSVPAIEHPFEQFISVQYFASNRPGYIAGYLHGIGYVEEATGHLHVLKELIDDKHKGLLKMNDGVVDPKGRFWIGEIDIKTQKEIGLGFTNVPIGRLWRYDPDGSVHLMIDGGLAISNGISFSPDFKTFYLNDSFGQLVYAFDFDLEAGTISNKKIIRDYRGTKIEPDGLVTDVDGNLWIALNGGNAVIKMAPSGEILQTYPVPAKLVTCPAWAGENRDYLLVTAGTCDGDNGGQIFKIKTDTKGMPDFEYTFPN